ncbi:TnsA endonuclease N-terminal domain-containing protein [Mycolicibacterium conceptionense]|uniref:TnsA endonuclease N-terminal domain-containing protein n=1 Tax=Mycolicibacterium conceptionense TaxID=451644 RepID=UPI003204E018
MVDARQGEPWSADELGMMVAYIRAGNSRPDTARALGRTPGALAAVAHRLITPDRRPFSKSESWKMLCHDLSSTDPGADPDWWELYTTARKTTPAVSRPRPEPKPALSLPVPPVTVFAWPPTLHLDTELATEVWAQLVAAAAGELPDDRERYIVLRRLGLLDGTNTLQALGDELSLSRERVRQLEAKALARIGSRAARPGTAAQTLGAAIDLLAERSDHTLVARLVDSAGTQLSCPPTWLVKSVALMIGQSRDRGDQLGKLTVDYLAYRQKQARQQARAQQRQASIERCLDKWIDDAMWPAHTQALSDVPFPIFRQRIPKSDDRVGFSGSFHSEKLDKTVVFESLLEEAALLVAERSARVLTYQEQPCEVPYSRADGYRSVYIPDLLVTLTDGRILLVEVKPLWQMAVTDNLLKSQAGQRFAAEHGWGWVSVAHAGHTYADLLRRAVDPAVHATLTRELAAGPISWAAMLRLRQNIRIRALDVAAYAAQNDVAVSLTPYQLGS